MKFTDVLIGVFTCDNKIVNQLIQGNDLLFLFQWMGNETCPDLLTNIIWCLKNVLNDNKKIHVFLKQLDFFKFTLDLIFKEPLGPVKLYLVQLLI